MTRLKIARGFSGCAFLKSQKIGAMAAMPKRQTLQPQETRPVQPQVPRPVPQLNLERIVQDNSVLPWLLSNHPPRKPPRTFLGSLKNRHMVFAGTQRIKRHLQEPAYLFPEHFCRDTADVITRLFSVLSDDEKNSNRNVLRPLMLNQLIDYVIPAIEGLKAGNKRVEFSFPQGPPKDQDISVDHINFTYGPYPIPEGYIAQAWESFLTLVVPQEFEEFSDYFRHKKAMHEAMETGVFIRIDVRVKKPLLFTVYSPENVPLLQDKRAFIDLQFISPHFSPYDEIFVPTPDKKGWQLAWQWRLSDFDFCVTSKADQADMLLNPKHPLLSWSSGAEKVGKWLHPSKEFEQKYLSHFEEYPQIPVTQENSIGGNQSGTAEQGSKDTKETSKERLS